MPVKVMLEVQMVTIQFLSKALKSPKNETSANKVVVVFIDTIKKTLYFTFDFYHQL